MKGETQALHLEKMMQKHTLYPEYELAFPPMQVKRSSLKKLSKGDIFLLGLDSLKMVLLDENQICANVMLSKIENHGKIKIIQLNKSMIEQSNHKKYAIVKISLGMVQSRKVEVGHNIETTSLNLQEVIISAEDKNIAKGSLVNVDEEIAVEICEVTR